MKFSKLGALCAATAISATGLVLPLAQSAPAATLPSCGKVSSPPLSNGAAKSTFASCTPAALSLGGSGGTTKTPPPGTPSGSVGFKITWKGGKGTTTAAIKFQTSPTIGKCPKTGGYKRLIINGSVKAATGAAKNITKVGQKVTASQCVIVQGGNAGKSMLEPGTRFKM